MCVHGSFGHGSESFEPLRSLADAYRLEFIDRRGFGRSPPRPGGVDFEADADDIDDLIGEGAHLVAHSYGGLGVLLAAARRPRDVQSLTLIEPPAFALVADESPVQLIRERMASVIPAPNAISPGRWLATFVAALGSAAPAEFALSPAEEADVRASMRERPPWEAELDLDPIRHAGVPTLVVVGDWAPDPMGSKIAGAALRAVAEHVVRATAGRLLVVADATHQPQLEQPSVVVPAIRDHLDAAETRERHGA